MMYDYLIIGAGFFGSTFARLMTDVGKRCLIIEKRNHIGGNAYTQRVEDIDVHIYGPHVFHTSNKTIWEFVNKFSEFNNYINRPKAYNNGRLYSLPFNMNTFNQIWPDVITPEQAIKRINLGRLNLSIPARNLEEQALSMVGYEIYELLIKNYTKKQWQRDPSELSANILKRLPLRFVYDDNYYNDKYQGIPIDGYTNLFNNMLSGIDIELNVDFFHNKEYWLNKANKIVYTGCIDEWFNYDLGRLEYRSLSFDHKIENVANMQGNAVINYCDAETKFTRIIEHKHFKKTDSSITAITYEIPIVGNNDSVPYYPINDEKNQAIYNAYRNRQTTNVIFGGRLAEYQYYDMHQVIGSAMKTVKKELE